jgi:MoaA/NifB/PqqE/SkfB family radical SAM enzyme
MSLCHPAFVRLFLRMWRLFKDDPRCSLKNLLKTSWFITKEEKIIRHDGMLVYSSFLPPIPSKAAEQVLSSMDNSGNKGLFDALVTGRRVAPISMYVAVTGSCPYQCQHCSAVDRRHVPDLTTREMKKLLRDLQDMGTGIIGLTGGEPLVRDDLPELIAAIDDRSLTILFTSGFGLTQEKARALKKAGLFAVGVSLDSADAAVMNAQRGHAGAFEQAVQAVRHCRAAGLYTMTQTVAGRGSVRTGKLLDIIKLSGNIGAQEVRILENMPSGRLVKITSDHILTETERAELAQFHGEMNRRKGFPKVSVFAHTEDATRFGCGAGTQHSYIDAGGNLYPCDFVPLAFGNVREKPIAELWLDMHRKINKPRQICMIMELYAKKLLAGIEEFPVGQQQALDMIGQLEVMDKMPGFYRRLL